MVFDWDVRVLGNYYFPNCPNMYDATYGVMPAQDPGAPISCMLEVVPPRVLQLGSLYSVTITTSDITGIDADGQDEWTEWVNTRRFVP